MGKLWGITFMGNFAGSVAIAAVVSNLLFDADPYAGFITAMAVKKCSLPFLPTMVKAIGANWLVNLAVFQAATSNNVGGKLAGLWMPITAFVVLGLEHSVANMFLLPLAIMLGGDLTVFDMIFSNLIPVCIGNALGAGVFVSGMQWFALGSPSTRRA
jgi:formate/nitrite transporter FocA (FNT family)